MKAASGELNLTVITIVAVAAVLGFFWLIWPAIQTSINRQWANLEAGGAHTYIVVDR